MPFVDRNVLIILFAALDWVAAISRAPGLRGELALDVQGHFLATDAASRPHGNFATGIVEAKHLVPDGLHRRRRQESLERVRLEDHLPAAFTESGRTRSIPNIMLLNYRTCLYCDGVTDLPLHRANIKNTLMVNHPGIRWFFYDDPACRQTVARVHSEKLAKHFDEEQHGPYKSDMCRLAMLYEKGGYYFDNDFEALKDVRTIVPDTASLSTVIQFRGDQHIFQGFLAAAPGHPVLMAALNRTFDKYASGDRLKFHDEPDRRMGPEVLGAALRSWLAADSLHVGRMKKQNGTEFAYLFKEKSDALQKYGLQPRKGQGCCCNVAVVDGKNSIGWTHIIGANSRCDRP